MKNIFLTSAIIAVMSYPAIALDANNHIEPGSANDCVESTLGTATGPANLEADWTANTINLEWYNEDTKLTVPTTSNTCRYDGQITLPSTNPEKTGYTFRGWQVRAAQSCFAGFEDDFNNVVNWGSLAVNEVQGAYSSVNWRGIYQVDLGFGEIGLETQCSTTTANVGDTATEDELVVSEINEGDCWCKITDFTPKNGNKCSIASSRWVYEGTPTDMCEYCYYDCLSSMQYEPTFYAVILGQSNQ